MAEVLLLFVAAIAGLLLLLISLKALVVLGKLLLALVLLPFQILGGLLASLGALIALPFQLLGGLIGILGLVVGLLLLPLLPLALLFLPLFLVLHLARSARPPAAH